MCKIRVIHFTLCGSTRVPMSLHPWTDTDIASWPYDASKTLIATGSCHTCECESIHLWQRYRSYIQQHYGLDDESQFVFNKHLRLCMWHRCCLVWEQRTWCPVVGRRWNALAEEWADDEFFDPGVAALLNDPLVAVPQPQPQLQPQPQSQDDSLDSDASSPPEPAWSDFSSSSELEVPDGIHLHRSHNHLEPIPEALHAWELALHRHPEHDCDNKCVLNEYRPLAELMTEKVAAEELDLISPASEAPHICGLCGHEQPRFWWGESWDLPGAQPEGNIPGVAGPEITGVRFPGEILYREDGQLAPSEIKNDNDQEGEEAAVSMSNELMMLDMTRSDFYWYSANLFTQKLSLRETMDTLRHMKDREPYIFGEDMGIILLKTYPLDILWYLRDLRVLIRQAEEKIEKVADRWVTAMYHLGSLLESLRRYPKGPGDSVRGLGGEFEVTWEMLQVGKSEDGKEAMERVMEMEGSLKNVGEYKLLYKELSEVLRVPKVLNKRWEERRKKFTLLTPKERIGYWAWKKKSG